MSDGYAAAVPVPKPADDTLREQLIGALVTEWMKRSDAQVTSSPTEHCAALADAVLPRIYEHVAEAWDEGFQAGAQWTLSTATGIPIDPPVNPYHQRRERKS